MTQPVRCTIGGPVAGGIEAECPTHHATEHHLPATTRTRQAGDGDKSRNNFTASNPFAPDAQTAAGQAPAAQTAAGRAHCQFRIRVCLGVGAARILPPPVPPPIFRPIIWDSPILQPKDHQLRRCRHRRGRFPVHRHHGTHSHDPRFTCTSPRSTSSMSPSSESGCASTHALPATCQRRNAGDQDDPSSGPPTHPDGT